MLFFWRDRNAQGSLRDNRKLVSNVPDLANGGQEGVPTCSQANLQRSVLCEGAKFGESGGRRTQRRPYGGIRKSFQADYVVCAWASVGPSATRVLLASCLRIRKCATHPLGTGSRQMGFLWGTKGWGACPAMQCNPRGLHDESLGFDLGLIRHTQQKRSGPRIETRDTNNRRLGTSLSPHALPCE